MAQNKIKWQPLTVVDRAFILEKIKKKSILSIVFGTIYFIFILPALILTCFDYLKASPDVITQLVCMFVSVLFISPLFVVIKNIVVFVCILFKMGKTTTFDAIGITPDYEENKKRFITVAGKKRKYKIRTLGIDGRDVSLKTKINILAPIPCFRNVLFAIPVNKKSK